MRIVQLLILIATHSSRLAGFAAMNFDRLISLGNHLSLNMLVGAARGISRCLQGLQRAAPSLKVFFFGSVEVAWPLFCLILAVLLICKDYGWLPWLIETGWGRLLAPLALILPLLPILHVYEHATDLWKAVTHLAGCPCRRKRDRDPE